MLILGRQFQWYYDPSQSSRCDIYRRFARFVGQNQCLQEAHGLELPVGLVRGKRFQFRLSRVVHGPGDRRGQAYYNYAVRPITASDEQGVSVFYKDESGEVFHTYSCHGRGIDLLNAAYQYLDLVPKGRDEDGFDFAMAWVRRHDQY